MNIRHFAVVLLLAATAGAAQASSLALVPSADTVAQNGAFTVNLVLDAADAPGAHPGLYGGEIVVNFDRTLLTYGNFALAGGLSFFSAPVVATNGNNQTVTFGFDNAPDTGTVGTFSFTATGTPGSIATLGLIDADDFSGSFASYVPTYQRFYPTFTGTQVTISAVPLPAGIWLLGTAVGALAARRRFRPAAAGRAAA
ncbi:MAG: VPLPA-CTERM sorting domain-containing protein [Gammaproteobacteria bacterium]